MRLSGLKSVLSRCGVALLTLAWALWLTSSSAWAQMSLGERALHAAAENNNVDAIRSLLRQGIRVDSPDPDGWTPLIRASAKGSLGAVGELLRAGADVTVMSKDGATPLLAAVGGGRGAVVMTLLDAGANPHQKNSAGIDAITWATQAGHQNMARLLAQPHWTTQSSPKPAMKMRCVKWNDAGSCVVMSDRP